MTQPTSTPAPLFIVGMPRSGTKLLRDLLNRHSELGIPEAETELLPHWAPRWPSYGDLRDVSNFHAFAQQYTGSAFFTYLREERGIEVDARRWHAACREYSLAGVFEGLVRVTSEVPAGGVWGDKSPGYVRCIPLILRVWPNARVVHLVRDGRDQCLSLERAWGKDVLRAAQRWSDDVGAALRLESVHPESILRVRYEDLLDEPEGTLRTVLSHVGLDWEPQCLELVRPSENLGDAAGSQQIVRSNTNKWVSQMSPQLRSRVEAIAGETLAQAGYEVDERGSARLSTPARRWAQAKDGWRLLRFDVGARGWAGALAFRMRMFRESGELER